MSGEDASGKAYGWDRAGRLLIMAVIPTFLAYLYGARYLRGVGAPSYAAYYSLGGILNVLGIWAVYACHRARAIREGRSPSEYHLTFCGLVTLLLLFLLLAVYSTPH